MGFQSKALKKDILQKAIDLSRLGQLSEATALLKTALENPGALKNPLACARNLGFFLIQNGKEGPFISWIQGQGHYWKEDPFLLFLQGQAFFRLEEYEKAKSSYQSALKNPLTKPAWREQIKKDLVALKLCTEQIQKAKSSLERARFLIGGGGFALLLGVSLFLLILRRMKRRTPEK